MKVAPVRSPTLDGVGQGPGSRTGDHGGAADLR
ncbi:hypothetical protein DFQ13_104242 [Actinokineospora spheciospongiae]|nr:hypothetical protein DFQ13_104242 [Actinokineospora spheciospongiae]